MPRIAGVDVPANKRIEVGLTYIYGIGRTTAKKILEASKVDLSRRGSDLDETEIARIRKVIEDDYRVEGDLRKETTLDIKRLMELGCYRGQRHKRGLPVRGQNTRANARTRKGPRKTVAGKKSVKALK
ncbi:MAG: 30S ribosomal protein S13 [Oligoflexia bacterium]|nr:30S ribosomal protein S13 [Oligoflexia bacterium]